MAKGKFTVKQITPFKDIIEQRVTQIPESDLCFQSVDTVIQLEYQGVEEVEKYAIKPGFFTLQQTNVGIVTVPIEFRKRNLLEEITSTSSILKEARTFFKKLHIYEQLDRPKKRGVLLYSAPGCGKSSSIEKFCKECMAEDAGTVVLVWPTSQIESDSVLAFLSTRADYACEATRLILVIEDIGGGEPGDYRGASAVDSGLLNLLDGIGITFKLPTFIVATTNHPESLLKSLADRPGRFDLMLKLNPPSHIEKIKLLEFIAKRPLTDDEKDSIGKKGTEDFSVAHLEEIVVRSLLHEKTYMEIIDEMLDHTKRFNKAFEEGKNNMGFGS